MNKSNTSSKPAKGEHSLRIIGGSHRGRKLPIPNLEGLRPTSDRMRETIFNWLQADVPGATVLDCFAGTGALGIEAISRGAQYCTFIEPQAIAAKSIADSLTLLSATNGAVVRNTADRFLNQVVEPFDLIFLDPPFSLDLWDSTLQLICEKKLLKPNGIVYLECPKQQNVNLERWQVLKEKTTGAIRFLLLVERD